MVRISATKPKTNNWLKLMITVPAVLLASRFLWFSPSPFPLEQTAPREILVPASHCEGYWPDTEICLKLGPKRPALSKLTTENTGCPQWRIPESGSWENKREVTQKLQTIQDLAQEWEKLLISITPEQLKRCGGEAGVKPPVWIARQRGLAWSRIAPGDMAGNSEYHTESGECWTDALLPMYMNEYNVEPSIRFQKFVLSFDVHGFHDSLADLKNRMGPP